MGNLRFFHATWCSRIVSCCKYLKHFINKFIQQLWYLNVLLYTHILTHYIVGHGYKTVSCSRHAGFLVITRRNPSPSYWHLWCEKSLRLLYIYCLKSNCLTKVSTILYHLVMPYVGHALSPCDPRCKAAVMPRITINNCLLLYIYIHLYPHTCSLSPQYYLWAV